MSSRHSLVAAVVAVLANGCGKTDEPSRGSRTSAASATASASASNAIVLGTDVVGAISKTSFRQGKVTKTAGGRVTIEAVADESGRKPTWTLTEAKVWPIAAPEKVTVGEALLCRTAAQAWYSCSVVTTGEKITAIDAYGARHVLEPAALIRPDEATQKDIHDQLAREVALREFDAALEKAGIPAKPVAWAPKKGDAVVAHFVASAWYAATIVEVKDKGKARIHWAGDAWPDRDLPLDEIAPPPTQALPVTQGQMALVRPSGSQTAWEAAKIVARHGDQVEIALRDGKTRKVDGKDVLPFVSPGG
jgi:hypothetical protein